MSLPDTRIEAVAEALYALLPAHVRHVDLTGTGALRALFDVLGQASGEIDAELDACYDALFVETAGEAGLAAIAALVAAPTLHRLPGESGTARRSFVANTIRYRRGKGTARVLESMAADVTGLPAVAVEYYQRLARCAHLIDVRPDRPATAVLTPGGTLASTGSAFDLLPRLLDVRPVTPAGPGRPAGRHAPPSVGVHLWRPIAVQFAAPAAETVPSAGVAGVPRCRRWRVGGTEPPGYFQLAAQPGAVLRLVNPDRRSEAAGRRPGETDIPDRLRRLPLHLETAEIRAAAKEGRPARLADRRWFDEATGAPFTVFLRRLGETTFRRVPPGEIRIVNLEDPPQPPGARPAAEVTLTWFEPGDAAAVRQVETHPIACAVDPVTGRVLVPAPAAGGPDVAEVRMAAATGVGLPIGAGAQDRNAPDQPFDVRDTGGPSDLVWVVDPSTPVGGSAETSSRTVATLGDALAEVAATGAGRRSFVLLARCDPQSAPAGGSTIDILLPPASEVHVIAAQWRAPRATPGLAADPGLRGFIVRRDRRCTAEAPVRVRRGAGDAAVAAGRLVLDGLELTAGLVLGARSVDTLDLRFMTVRSPGAVAISADGSLVAARITVDRSICGAVRFAEGAPVTVSGEVLITGSIITADGVAGDALSVPDADVSLRDVTVLGSSSLRTLSATNPLFTGPVKVTRRQSGCVRYGFVPGGSEIPRAFRCQPALALAVAAERAGRPLTAGEADAVRLGTEPVLMDTSPDEPALAMLHPLCPGSIRSGGEDDAEMGAFARAASGTAVADIETLFDEYLPVALAAGVIDDTRSGAVAARRNRP